MTTCHFSVLNTTRPSPTFTHAPYRTEFRRSGENVEQKANIEKKKKTQNRYKVTNMLAVRGAAAAPSTAANSHRRLLLATAVE